MIAPRSRLVWPSRSWRCRRRPFSRLSRAPLFSAWCCWRVGPDAIWADGFFRRDRFASVRVDAPALVAAAKDAPRPSSYANE